MKVGEKINFNYTGTPQEFIVPVDGIYKLEVWGAEGGSGGYFSSTNISEGGKGGYASGVLTLAKDTVFYIYVGEQGKGYNKESIKMSGSKEGGWNGGGSSLSDTGATGGGGATDIRLFKDVWNDSTSLLSRIIVAGGGGGGGNADSDTSRKSNGGYGGGSSGGETPYTQQFDKRTGGGGGTQTSGGASDSGHSSFGIGASTTINLAGGGGGGWYGGGAGENSTGAGGGSGYVLTETSYKPSGYSPTSDYWMVDTQLLAGNSSIPLTVGEGTQTGNSGNGFARITLIESLLFLRL